MEFDATCLYPSAMWDINSVYPEAETGFAFKPHMKDVYVEASNNQSFNQDGNEGAILGIENYKAPDLILQHFQLKKKLKKKMTKGWEMVFL